jgi:hypothetical protein
LEATHIFIFEYLIDVKFSDVRKLMPIQIGLNRRSSGDR